MGEQQYGQLLVDLDDLCRSDSLSEDGLRAIIERHGFAPNNGPNISNYQFFLLACCNERVTEGILRYLLENFPNAVRAIGEEGRSPLHIICCFNKNVTLGMVELLIDAFPDSVRHENNKGSLPLHGLCNNENLDDKVTNDIFRLLLERNPESVRHATREGKLPIHAAAGKQSPEFCRILIEAYPGSERISDDAGSLPLHFACVSNTVTTAKYLYQLYPESITVATRYGCPIHFVIFGVKLRTNDPANAIDMVQFLLNCNPDVVSQELHGKLPLYWTCFRAINEDTPTKLNAYLKILQILYDIHPGAIERDEITSGLGDVPQEIRAFISTHRTYARQASDLRQMNTPDENGQLPLHRALCDNVRLGSIKLLVKGNPCGIRCYDKRGTTPLHVACQHHETPGVVEYLINLDPTSLRAKDFDDNTLLHYACRSAKHKAIALLLDRYGAVSVSKENVHNQIPIDLLFKSVAVSDREGIEYTESIFRLIRAYPDTINYISNNMTQIVASREERIPQNSKKRKVDNM